MQLIKIRCQRILSAHRNPFYYEWVVSVEHDFWTNLMCERDWRSAYSVRIKVQYWSINLDLVCAVNQAANKKWLRKSKSSERWVSGESEKSRESEIACESEWCIESNWPIQYAAIKIGKFIRRCDERSNDFQFHFRSSTWLHWFASIIGMVNLRIIFEHGKCMPAQ